MPNFQGSYSVTYKLEKHNWDPAVIIDELKKTIGFDKQPFVVNDYLALRKSILKLVGKLNKSLDLSLNSMGYWGNNKLTISLYDAEQ